MLLRLKITSASLVDPKKSEAEFTVFPVKLHALLGAPVCQLATPFASEVNTFPVA